ncbi:MAG: hypothetical protein NZ529_01020, partial [Cytophagaceae bacterium]|nr:hypothetical protein [Cytophagaceae bacterium]MDW8455346.1 hypothetical protein [Cytophagaceae bacterium]
FRRFTFSHEPEEVRVNLCEGWEPWPARPVRSFSGAPKRQRSGAPARPQRGTSKTKKFSTHIC